MSSRLGPILTAGVVLSAAAAVVANPVIAPRGDLKVPAIALSAGHDDDLAMLDNDFLDAIAPASTELSSNPLSVLNDLFTSLAADASYLGRSAIIAIFSSGVTAVVDTDLTAVSTPYPGVAPDVAAAAPWTPAVGPLPPLPLPALGPVPLPNPGPVASLLSAEVPAEVAHLLEQALGTVADDATAGGDRVWTTAASAVGALLQTGDRVVMESLRRLVDDGVQPVLERLLTVVPALSGHPDAIPDTVRTLIMPGAPLPRPVPATGSTLPVEVVSAPVEGVPPPAPLNIQRAERVSPPPVPTGHDAVPGAAAAQIDLSASVLQPAPDVTAPAVPTSGAGPKRSDPRDAAAAVREQTRDVLNDVRDALRKATSRPGDPSGD